MSRKKRETAEQPSGDGPSFSELADADAAEAAAEELPPTPPLFSDRDDFRKAIAEGVDKGEADFRARHAKPELTVENVDMSRPGARIEYEPQPSGVEAAIAAAADMAGALASKRSDGTPTTLAELRQLERDIRALGLV